MLSLRLTTEEENALALAEGVLKLANDLIDAVTPDAIVVGAAWRPRSLGFALLCRSVSNFTGALTMARQNQAMECLTLVRSCFENMLLVAGLCERGAKFVKDMRSDNAFNLKGLRKLARPDVVGDTKYIEFIDGQVRRFLEEHAEKPERLSLDKPSELFFSAYRKYRAMSHDPAHASLSALARHFSPRHKLNVVPPFKPGERLVALALGCEALLTVCRGVDLLMGGTAQSEAIGAFCKRFVNETSEPD
jgi:hypothetical protein